MFNLTKEMLKILLVLSKDPAWPVFLREFKTIRDENVENALHFNPPKNDFNAKQRQDLFRGVAVALDVLYHAFDNPIALLEEIQLAERITEAQNMADSG
jgi:hypothetical protein